MKTHPALMPQKHGRCADRGHVASRNVAAKAGLSSASELEAQYRVKGLGRLYSAMAVQAMRRVG